MVELPRGPLQNYRMAGALAPRIAKSKPRPTADSVSIAAAAGFATAAPPAAAPAAPSEEPAAAPPRGATVNILV